MKKLILIVTFLVAACTANKNTSKPTSVVKPNTSVKPTTTQPAPVSETTTMDFSGPPTTVYKTKQNYNDKVPITLSDDKAKIVAYPSPKDVFYNGNLAYPTPLAQGYLLDNRGIGKNVAFLSITYQEYSNLPQAPNLQDMYTMIIDKDPLLQMCNCGNRYKYSNPVAAMNQLISDNKLDKCQKIK